MTERSFEASEDDAAEQQADVVEHEDEPTATDGSDEVDPADRAEQERVVEADDDEYR
ncbi:MAG: hypothetical protein QOJ60_388 [Actinomycetota bacterium]|jgi:hypothetical protein|nr:hypothetical protein [Actinomycetota bacterium]